MQVSLSTPLGQRLRRFLFGSLLALFAVITISKLYVVKPIREEVAQRVDWELASEIANQLERDSGEPSAAAERISRWLSALRPDIRVFLVDGLGRTQQLIPTFQLQFGRSVPLAPLIAATDHALPRLPIRMVDPECGDLVIFSAAKLSARWNSAYLVALPAEAYKPLSGWAWIHLLIGEQIFGGVIILWLLACWLTMSVFTRWIVAPVRAIASAFRRATDSQSELSDFELGRFKELDQLLYAETSTLVARHARLAAQELQDRSFMARFVHDLRTPFTALLGFLQLLCSTATSDRREQPTEDIKRNTRYLDHISLALNRVEEQLKPLREFASMGALGASFKPTPTDMAALALETAAIFEASAQESGITLTTRIDTSLPQLIADPLLISRAVSNLLANAIRYTPKGGSVELVVRSTTDVEPGVSISVRDSGIGISDKHLAHLGEEFYRVNNEHVLSTDSGGTGLGLANVKAILTLHQSTLRIDSKVGMGSTFSFTLLPPVSAAPATPCILATRLHLAYSQAAANSLLLLFVAAVGAAQLLLYLGKHTFRLTALELLSVATASILINCGRFGRYSGAALQILTVAAMAIVPFFSVRHAPELSRGPFWFGLMFSVISALLLAIPAFKPIRISALCSLIAAIAVREYLVMPGTISLVMILSLPSQFLVYKAYYSGSYTKYVTQAALGLFGLLWALGSLLTTLFYNDLWDRLSAQSVINKPATGAARALSLNPSETVVDGLETLSLFAPGTLFLLLQSNERLARVFGHYDGAGLGDSVLVSDEPSCSSGACVNLLTPSTPLASIRSARRLSVDSALVAPNHTLLVAPFASTGMTLYSRVCQGRLTLFVALPFLFTALVAALLLKAWLRREVTGPLGLIAEALRRKDPNSVDLWRCRSMELRQVCEGMRELYSQLSDAETKLNEILRRRRTLVASFADCLGRESRICGELLKQIEPQHTETLGRRARELLARVETVANAMKILFDFACLEAKPTTGREGTIDLIEVIYETQIYLESLGFIFQVHAANQEAIVRSGDVALLAIAIRMLTIGLLLNRDGDSNSQIPVFADSAPIDDTQRDGVLEVSSSQENSEVTICFERSLRNTTKRPGGFATLVGALHLEAAQRLLSQLALPHTLRHEAPSTLFQISFPRSNVR